MLGPVVALLIDVVILDFVGPQKGPVMTHRDPNHAEAQRMLRQAQAITHRPIDL